MGRERRAVCAARCHCAVCVVRGARGAGELCEWGCEWGGDYKVVCACGVSG